MVFHCQLCLLQDFCNLLVGTVIWFHVVTLRPEISDTHLLLFQNVISHSESIFSVLYKGYIYQVLSRKFWSGAKSGPRGPLLGAKTGPPGPDIDTIIGPPVPKVVRPIMKCQVHRENAT